MKFKERIDDAIDALFDNNQCLAAEVAKLGYPILVEGYPSTAAVAWNDNKKRTEFLFNKHFIETLTDEELQFVIAHEAQHIINMHIFLFKEKLGEMKRKKKTNKEIDRFFHKLNVAADCVVNDSLTRLYNIPRLKTVGWLIEDRGLIKRKKPLPLIYGIDQINKHAEDMTAMQVYYALPEKKYEGSENHMWESFLNDDGTFKREFIDQIRDFIEKHMEDSNFSADEAVDIDEMIDEMKDSTDQYVKNIGHGASTSRRRVANYSRNSINWTKLVDKITDTRQARDIWHKPNRRYYESYPEVILPTQEVIDKEEVFLAIDTSSSIDLKALQIFVDVARSTPSRFKIKAINFDTKCYPWNINGDKLIGGGGTNFGIIEDYIVTKLSKYPKAIFVLTDGEGTPFAPKHPERWCWLLYGSCSRSYTKGMKSFDIASLLR